ncbi:Putative peroxiredoxin bcp [Maioricimonas rarisocia]|uniref:thioredoxin-dependent peroxiredoxin n=1 Tax=Maioricimonas rarisocia TaxID=2528026 RepID=A0A517ZC49_9PLAN|nr:peroxiredoxin [Maioricimonas rarisocia]QDU40058.1 Putative peroxiredoxin bcp [Maioricimonas rarisocia]
MATRRTGDDAPDFRAASHTGQVVHLSDYRGRTVVLFFYPRDESPVCTKEVCAFRDAYEEFVRAGAVVIGVSSDSVDSHQQFARQHRLPFVLISDSGGEIRSDYGIRRTFGLLPGRTTFVIDREGTIRHVFSGQFVANRHVEEAMGMVHRLAAESAPSDDE